MILKQSRDSSNTTSQLGETKPTRYVLARERQTLGASGESDRYLSLNSDTPARPRILIVTDMKKPLALRRTRVLCKFD